MLFKKLNLIPAFAIVFAMTLMTTGCAKDDAEEIAGLCPIVLSTIPVDEAVNVPLDQVISATFNEELNPETVTSGTYSVSGASELAGEISYSEMTAFFTPAEDLLPFTIYTGTVTTGIEDTYGNALQENYVWSFTTIPELSLSVAPEASGTVSGAGLFDNESTVTAVAVPGEGFEFINWTKADEVVSTNSTYEFQMDGNIALVANFEIATYLLEVTAVNGSVTTTPDQAIYSDGTEVILEATPATGYEFSSWSGDATGTNNPLTVTMNADKAVTANFTQVNTAEICANPAVDLGLAGDYAILAKSGISTTGNTSITGDLGISPNSSTAITGFGLILHSSGTYSTSSLVTGRVYASDYSSPTPANLTTAVSNMETAFTTANGIAPDQTELLAGNINGQTLASGVYKWSSGLSVTNSVTLDGGGVDCAKFVFQIAGDLTIADNTEIILINGAKADNIYWVVAGAGAVLGTDVNFSGNILSQTLISVNTRSTVVGRLLAQSAVTLDANAVVKPSN
ncbi:ice-binding family protein [Psychroflexus sediminis]|uniref:Listeria/Bacterioides repeat-containing protein n=1 Tax=Psychroflexus sediminis TaxID=470826 RepID=A0A1G7XBI7_9FLAO|nr:ice-binding family protein [Psychroflexus sediminis]SDG81556.1 Listeria/Bacterioides repeat-containing protein [Psychroflexus sediminis]